MTLPTRVLQLQSLIVFQNDRKKSFCFVFSKNGGLGFREKLSFIENKPLASNFFKTNNENVFLSSEITEMFSDHN